MMEDTDDTPLPPELRMDEYDDEEDEPNPLEDLDDMADGMDMEFTDEGGVPLAYDALEEEKEDEEDDEIRVTDSVLVLAVTEDEQSHLEVQVYTEDGHLYTHHDIMLPDFPLALAWMDIPPYVSNTHTGEQKTVGNYLAVGTFSPAIEIWNLDVLDPIEPSATLGGEDPNALSKRGKKLKEPKLLPGSHEEAVMTLSWNSVYRQLLASGSADNTVKLWDVTTQQCSYTFSHHTDKVQSVLWHPNEAWLLASGGYDKRIGLIDGRNSAIALVPSTLKADVESLAWDPFSPYHLYGSLENGEVFCIDIRKVNTNGAGTNSKGQANKDQSLVFSFMAHHKTTSSLCFSSQVQGMLATCSIDKTVKVWDVQAVQQSVSGQNTHHKDLQPKCIAYKTMNVGKLMSVRYSHDDPFLLATGGDKGVVAIWESDELETIRGHFESRIVAKKSAYAELVTLSSETAGQTAAAAAAVGEVANNVQIAAVMAANAQVTPVIDEDDSWMNDNEGIAGPSGRIQQGSGSNVGEGKKKKKKKSAK
jgi:periodic tryptophan protein 1